MQLKSKSFLGVRSSVLLTVLSAILLAALEVLKGMPQTKWVVLAIAVIGALLVLINKEKEEEPETKEGT